MRSIIFGVFQSLVVLLYILDNETNFVVQVSVFIGLLIDLWKITKVMDVKVSACRFLVGFFLKKIKSNLTHFCVCSWTEKTKLQE